MGAAIWFIFAVACMFLGIWVMTSLTSLTSTLRPLLAIIFFALMFLNLFFAISDMEGTRREGSPESRRRRQSNQLRTETGMFLRARKRRQNRMGQ